MIRPIPRGGVCDEDFDLLVACGAALARVRKPEEAFSASSAGSRENPSPRDLNLEDIQVWIQSPAGRGGTEEDPQVGTSARTAIQVLETMMNRKSPLLIQLGLASEPPPLVALIALLIARLVLEGEWRTNREPLPRILPFFERRPSDWRPVLRRIERYLESPARLVEAEKHGEPPSLLARDFSLTDRACILMGLARRTDAQGCKKVVPHQSDGKLDLVELVRNEKPRGFEDLVLPAETMDVLRDIVRVCESERRAPPVMMFQGMPGTGKSHAARCLAGSLGRPLAIAQTSAILDKWVGATEKNLTSIFREARERRAVLLLDEADSLLRTRSLARYVWEITEVNVLLALLESPSVPVILCTNLFPVLDPALHRRITFLLEFPLPEPPERAQIWKLRLRDQRIAGPCDLKRLAEVPLSGGLIKSVAVQAARLRSIRRGKWRCTTESLLALAQKEMEKMPDEHLRREVGFGRR